jgi:hypothetical protein
MQEMPEQSSSTAPRWSLVVLVAALCCIVAVGGVFLIQERKQSQELAAANQKLSAALTQVQSQLATVSEKLATLPPPQPALPARPSPMEATTHPKTAHRVAARRPVDDPRWNQVESQLSAHEKQLASTREDVEKTRAELQGSLNSTRDELNGSITRSHDELNGSIARTHEELVALEKRGERNYYEFQLDKSKSFQRIGPFSLSLRKVNFKKKSYNLAMMVDDFQLNKNSVNLYEPVWITLSDRPQPVELVVNHIQKDHVQGYVSEPKYKQSELASMAAPQKPQSAAVRQ